jgi:hypothetical protein
VCVCVCVCIPARLAMARVMTFALCCPAIAIAGLGALQRPRCGGAELEDVLALGQRPRARPEADISGVQRPHAARRRPARGRPARQEHHQPQPDCGGCVGVVWALDQCRPLERPSVYACVCVSYLCVCVLQSCENPHHCVYRDNRTAVNERGLEVEGPFNGNYSDSVFRLHHYQYRTLEDYLLKRFRGRATLDQWAFTFEDIADNIRSTLNLTHRDDNVVQRAVGPVRYLLGLPSDFEGDS